MENLAHDFYVTPAAHKSAVDRDLQETRRDLVEARVAVKKASARSRELSKTDKDLLARSRGQIANIRDRFKEKEENSFRPPIDRKMLERHLKQAERHVAVGQEHVSQQRERIAQLERDGYDASNARGLLEEFEELERMHVAHRDRLARQLGNASIQRALTSNGNNSDLERGDIR